MASLSFLLHHKKGDELKVIEPGDSVHQSGGSAAKEQAVQIISTAAVVRATSGVFASSLNGNYDKTFYVYASVDRSCYCTGVRWREKDHEPVRGA